MAEMHVVSDARYKAMMDELFEKQARHAELGYPKSGFCDTPGSECPVVTRWNKQYDALNEDR
jgi:hypothetical protein